MNCNDCIHAKWVRDKRNRVMKKKAGVCAAPYVLDDAPYSVSSSYIFRLEPHRSHIHYDRQFDNCPSYKEKQ